MVERYAIYFTLDATDPLYQLASIWLGYDTWSGKVIDQMTRSLVNEKLGKYEAYTTSPNRYGFHATLKAPFRLKQGKTIDELDEALKNFSQQIPAFNCEPLTIQSLDQFLALRPEKQCDNLNVFAEQCVKNFDEFRAPLNKAEIEKRNPQQLTHRQREYLEQWGYPFVRDEFQFHLTLSNKLDAVKLQQLSTFLGELFSLALANPLVVKQIALSYQADTDKRFKIIKNYSLKGAAE